MKKSLLNYKSLHFAILLLLLCANISVAQRTIIHETFGGATIADPYTGGTSTTPASPNQITYSKVTSATTSAAVSVATASSNGYLSITNSGTTTTGITYLTAPIPSGNFVQVLKDNPYPITWTFNMRFNKTTNIVGLTTNPNTNYAPAEVLVASSSDLLSETTKGYAVSISLGSAAGQQKIELNSFTNGLGFAGTTPVPPVSIISSPDFPAQDYVSVKVTYTPSTNTWSLAVKDSGTGPFTDPATDTYPTTQTIVNDVNTSATMTHFGYFYSHRANSVSNSVFRTDNFKVVLESPFVPLPTVEKRQAFNSITSPTVLNLSATGVNGGTINWYDVTSGGLPLSSSTSLDYKNYYVSQTVSGVESDRVVSQVFVGDTNLKTLPLYEGFANYNISDKLIIMNNSAADGIGLGSWTITPGTNINDDVTIVASPTWTTNLTATSGNAITFVGSGIDPELKFTDTTSGSLYSSFLFTATDAASIVSASDAAAAANPPTTVPEGVDPAKSTPTGIYGFLSETTDSGTGIVTTGYSSDVMFRKVFGTTNKFNIGLSKSNNGEECIWSPTDYDFGTQYLIMISYDNIGDADPLNQVANLWIDPTTTTLPIPAPTLTQNNPTTSVSRDHIDRIKILQASSSSTPLTIIDEIRVANNWGQALGAAETLGGITSDINTGFKMYPNPVLNGKLYISSASNLEKEVTIYNTLGQEIFESKTNNQAVNVSSLSKGTYFVKITEAEITATKKLIIQ